MKLSEQALEKLAMSGLSEKDGAALKFYEMPYEDVSKEVPPAVSAGRSALIIPYFHPLTRKPCAFNPKWKQFERFRFLGRARKTLADQTDGKGQPKYWQRPKSGVLAYFPLLANWPEIANDTHMPVIITEGELKAAKACKEGLPAIGLGGVWNFMSKEHGLFFLPDLELINWHQRIAYIIYDSDILSKPGVAKAANTLSEEFFRRGAIPYVGYLPPAEEGKTGLDDYLLEHSAEEFREEVLSSAEPLTAVRLMYAMNNKLLYVKNPGMMLKATAENEWTTQDIKTFSSYSEYTLDNVSEKQVSKNGETEYVKINAAKRWLEWPLRASVEKISYKPGITGPVDDGSFSVWPGWGCKPEKGPTKPFDDLFDFLTSALTPQQKKWLLQWFAYPIQNPGVKMHSCVVMYGRAQGTGKTLMGEIIKKIYGKNAVTIAQRELDGDFNAWAENKQFIVGDEVTGNDNRKLADKLKNLITQTYVVINKKYMPEYVVDDCVNYYFTTNHSDAFFFEDQDRRYFVCDVKNEKRPPEFYKEVDDWKNNGGASYLFYKLLRVDLKGFNPMGEPPRTEAKVEMMRDGFSDHGAWLRDLMESPDEMLKMGEASLMSDLYSAKQLLGLYDPMGTRRLTTTGMAKECKKAGVPMYLGGRQIRIAGFGQERYFIIRNKEKWFEAPVGEAVKHISETRGKAAKGKY